MLIFFLSFIKSSQIDLLLLLFLFLFYERDCLCLVGGHDNAAVDNGVWFVIVVYFQFLCVRWRRQKETS